MLKLKKSMQTYFKNSTEMHRAQIPLGILFREFPDSEVRLKTSKSVVFVQKGDMEIDNDIQPLIDINEPYEPSHAEKVQKYFAEKEAEADKIFKEAANALSEIGKEHLIKKLKTAVTFYESGDWIDEDNLARKGTEK